MTRVFYCQSDPSTKNEEDENFCRVNKVTDRSKCELMGSRLLVIGHMSRENSDWVRRVKSPGGCFWVKHSKKRPKT